MLSGLDLKTISVRVRQALAAGIAYAAKGDIVIGTGTGTVTIRSAPTNGKVRLPDSAQTDGWRDVAVLNKAIYGFTYGNGNGAGAGDLTNDITIFAGGAMDSTGTYFMVGSQLTKQLDVAWAVGNNAGGILSGAAADVDYNLWEIARPDTEVVEYGFETTANATPTLPANYTKYRLIGWFKRVAGTIVAFHTYETEGGGLELVWDSPTLDVEQLNALTTARRTDAVKVPLNFSVEAHLNVVITDAASGSRNWVYCPDQADLAPSLAVAPLYNIFSAGGSENSVLLKVRTSSAGLIAARSNLATVDAYRVSTMGFRWARRN